MSSSTQGARSKTRLQLWLVIAAFAAPIIGAHLAYYVWRPAATANYGELLSPTRLPEADLSLTDGSGFRLSTRKGKWILIAVDSGRCDAMCEEKLYAMRQVRLALGKHRDRVERAWLIDDAVMPQPNLAEKYAATWMAHARGSVLLQHLGADISRRDYLYLVDPIGNLMMRFPRDPDLRRMLKDLNRLMLASQNLAPSGWDSPLKRKRPRIPVLN